MKTKKCSRCGKVLPLSDFYTNKSKPDGYGCYCKECARSIQREYETNRKAKMNSEKVKEVAKDPVELPTVPVVKVQIDTPAQKTKTLDDFQPRDIIKHLYKLGYRIENNKLVCMVKQTVNMRDIING